MTTRRAIMLGVLVGAFFAGYCAMHEHTEVAYHPACMPEASACQVYHAVWYGKDIHPGPPKYRHTAD